MPERGCDIVGSVVSDAAVLVVEDEPAVRSALTAVVQRHGWRAIAVPSLSAASNALHDARGGIVAAIIDLKLDDGLGLGLLRQLRTPPFPIASIVLSGMPTAEAGQMALAEGAFRLLRKPCPADVLRVAVVDAVARTNELRGWLSGRTSQADQEDGPWSRVPAQADRFIDHICGLLVESGRLSPAEARLIPPLLQGRDYADIARSRVVSVETIRSQVKSILHKLDVASVRALWRAGLAALEQRAAP